MGFFDDVEEEKVEVVKEKAPFSGAPERKPRAAPLSISTSFLPLRLSAMKEDNVDMVVRVKNVSEGDHMVSVDAILPPKELIGFDRTCISKHHEKKLGNVGVGETKEFTLRIWGSNQTRSGSYPIELRLYSHYLDYDKVLSSMSKNVTLRVV